MTLLPAALFAWRYPQAADPLRLFQPVAGWWLAALAATLSGGEQQMLVIGRALMRKPQLMVMDEPSRGLSPVLVRVIYKAIADVRRLGMTILLAEQSAQIALRLADRACVLETGRTVVEGTAGALLSDLRVCPRATR